MQSLGRAKGFTGSRLRQCALVLIPLAMAAVPAGATAILDPANCSVSATTPGAVASGSCTSTFLSNGQLLYGNGSAPQGGRTAYGLQFDWLGTGSGFNANPIPVTYNFNATTAQNGTVDYSLQFLINGITELAVNGTVDATNKYSASGSGSLPFVGDVSSYEVKLILSQPTGVSYQNSISANVPKTSGIQIVPVSSAPEPATMLLVIPGAAALFLVRRRRRA